jgi:hypothetical protein
VEEKTKSLCSDQKFRVFVQALYYFINQMLQETTGITLSVRNQCHVPPKVVEDSPAEKPFASVRGYLLKILKKARN